MSTLRGTEELSLHGFEEPNFVSKTEYNNFRNQYSATLTRRRSRWDSQVVTDRLERTNQFKRFCRKGIPPSNRSEMWMVLSGAKFRMKDNPHVYRVAASKQPIQKLLSVILADLPRTYPENIRFRDENSPKSLIPSLKRVLSAFAVQFPHIGYCQGMNYITAILLLVVSGHGEEAEEKAFWLLDALVNHILPSYYADDMVSVRRDCMVLGQLLRSKDRAVYEMIEKSGANFTMLCAKWFICIYADVLPIEVFEDPDANTGRFSAGRMSLLCWTTVASPRDEDCFFAGQGSLLLGTMVVSSWDGCRFGAGRGAAGGETTR